MPNTGYGITPSLTNRDGQPFREPPGKPKRRTTKNTTQVPRKGRELREEGVLKALAVGAQVEKLRLGSDL